MNCLYFLIDRAQFGMNPSFSCPDVRSDRTKEDSLFQARGRRGDVPAVVTVDVTDGPAPKRKSPSSSIACCGDFTSSVIRG